MGARLSRRLGFLAAGVAAVWLTAVPASAGPVPTRIMAVNGAPVGLMSCRYDPTADHHNNGQEVIASFANLSSHLLLSVAVRVQIYDVENSLIGTGVVDVAPVIRAA